jgi:hypothetical protein
MPICDSRPESRERWMASGSAALSLLEDCVFTSERN